MPTPRFHRAVEKVARPMLEPLGFRFHKADEPGYGLYSFLRPWNAGWNHGVALQTSRSSRAFRVWLGVVQSDFWSSALAEVGPWRECGLRKRLGRVVHTSDPQLEDSDFIEYADQAGLEEALQYTIEQALVYGPTEWEHMGRRLLSGT